MSTVSLSDQTWQRIYAFLQTRPGLSVGNELKGRRFVEAVLWIARSGAQWRLLPKDDGKWKSLYKRFARWEQRGIWHHLFAQCAADPDPEWIIPDRTIVRAPPCAAGALKKTVDRLRKPSGAVAAGSAPRFRSAWMR